LVLLRAEIVFARSRGSNAPALFLDAARRFDALAAREARDAYLEGLGAAISAGRANARPSVRELAAAARAAPTPSTPPIVTELLLDAVAVLYTDGYRAAVEPLRHALATFRASLDGGADSTGWFWLAWLLAGELWDDELQEELAARAVRLARDAGALGRLPIALTYRAAAHIHRGEFAAAAGLIAESDSIIAATGQSPLGSSTVTLTAWSAGQPDALDRYRAQIAEAGSRGEGRVAETLGYVVALLNNGLGRYDVALAGTRDAAQYDCFGLRGFVLVELIEAATRAGAPEDAARALDELAERAPAAGTEWALGMLARSRALLLDGAAAEASYREAIERLAQTRIVVHLARAHLVYGEWLRRVNRRLDARAQLRTAYDLFHGIGAEGFAERARRELVATGETARPRTAAAVTDLTPQEATIARLAAAGQTNAEIGGELFISPRTVEYHLSKVFTKLGLTSRRDLRRVAAELRL
jgi:DNA-binding CsgD family transcriptional regulator